MTQTQSSRPTQNKGGILMVMLLTATLFIGIFIGNIWSTQQAVTNEQGEVEISKVLDLYSKTRSEEVSFDQFWDVWKTVKENHVHDHISDVDLFYGAIGGIVASLDDPYSVYFPPETAAEFARGLAGEFEGIGAEISMREGQLVVVAPLPGSPAEQSGLLPEDIIIAIDGNDTHIKSVEEAVLQIRGEKGTTVVLTVVRAETYETRDVAIVRDTINIPTVEWRQEAEGVAYLRVNQITDSTRSEFNQAVEEILKLNPTGIVLDLRNNPGGLLDVSIDIASEWIPSGVIVKEEFRDASLNRAHTSTGNHRFGGIPTVVLVNAGSASGAEIIAGALQDYRVATVLGDVTFGKGSVQDFEVLHDGSALKLTVAEWLTPNNRHINNVGLTPDILMEETFQLHDGNGDLLKEPIDIGLRRAIEILTN